MNFPPCFGLSYVIIYGIIGYRCTSTARFENDILKKLQILTALSQTCAKYDSRPSRLFLITGSSEPSRCQTPSYSRQSLMHKRKGHSPTDSPSSSSDVSTSSFFLSPFRLFSFLFSTLASLEEKLKNKFYELDPLF